MVLISEFAVLRRACGDACNYELVTVLAFKIAKTLFQNGPIVKSHLTMTVRLIVLMGMWSTNIVSKSKES